MYFSLAEGAVGRYDATLSFSAKLPLSYDRSRAICACKWHGLFSVCLFVSSGLMLLTTIFPSYYEGVRL